MMAGTILTPEQQALQAAARELARTVLAPLAAELDEQERFPTETVAHFREQGYLALAYPPELGGGGADLLATCLVVEELARVCASTAITLTGHITGATAVLAGAAPEQRSDLLLRPDGQPRLLGICISEPTTGSDVSGIITRAERSGSDYYLTGTKRFVTNGGQADAYVVIARTGDHPYRGLTAFLVPAHTAGLHAARKERKMGLRGSATCDLHLDGALVPAANRIGAEGEGFQVVVRTMEHTRTVVAAHALGIAEGALEYALGYAQQRLQFGHPIADFQALQFLFADLATKVESARLLVHHAAQLTARHDPKGFMYASMAKLQASDTAMEVSTQAVQVLGGNGYMRDYPVERMMRDAKVTQIFEGTNQIQRQIIWKQIQGGLPF